MLCLLRPPVAFGARGEARLPEYVSMAVRGGIHSVSLASVRWRGRRCAATRYVGSGGDRTRVRHAAGEPGGCILAPVLTFFLTGGGAE